LEQRAILWEIFGCVDWSDKENPGIEIKHRVTFWGVEGVSRTVGLIQPILLLMLVGASRAAARVWLGGLYR
jgi:hypothetical protein